MRVFLSSDLYALIDFKENYAAPYSYFQSILRDCPVAAQKNSGILQVLESPVQISDLGVGNWLDC